MEIIRYKQEGFSGIFLPADAGSASAIIYCDGAGNTPKDAECHRCPH